MRCRQFRRLVALKEGHDPGDRQRDSLREHAEACSLCSEFARDMQTLEGLLQRAALKTPPTGFEQAVMARIRLAKSEKQGLQPKGQETSR